jgi:predicted Zn-dependent peptidase
MNRMNVLVDETMYYTSLDNGLRIFLHPKHDFIDFHVSLQVGMGGESIDYMVDHKTYHLPAGTAHFLEHIYFENEDINISDIFASYNADINASTSRDVTNYYFSIQDDFKKVLAIFLNHFSGVKVSKRTIEKERSIIIKEIKMYEDNMFYKVHDTLIKQMYGDEKIWEDIAGTETSVNKINADIIKQAISHFYQPSNMTLVITGPFNPDEVLALIKDTRMNKIKSKGSLPRIDYALRGSDQHHLYQVNPQQAVNYMALGVKIDFSPFEHLSTSQKRLAIIMFFEYFFSESSRNYQLLKDAQLINYSYYTSIQMMDKYGYFILASESNRPKVLLNRVIDMLKNLGPIDVTLFEASKRSRIGHFIGYFDNAHSVNAALTDLIKKDIDVDKYLKHVKDISLDDVNLSRKSLSNQQIYSVIYAKKA